ncbi:MAG: HAD family hydrolase [Clostridia bacterium]|nr:HAD family hydrolase [Clostridia bacterium]
MENVQEKNQSLVVRKENIFVRMINSIKALFFKIKTVENIDSKIEMIMFDLDGTLWDTEEVSFEVMNEVIRKYDNLKEITKEQVAQTMGCSFAETAEIYMPYLEKEERENYLQEMLDEVAVRLTTVGGNVYEGLEDVLIELSKQYKLSIVSNCAAGYIESFLESSGLGKYFIDFAAAAKMKVPKSEAIKAVLERNNIKNAIYVGDTIKDFEASQVAELQFVQAKYGFGADLQTDHSIENISELPDVLKTIK